ncbi:hypothetical protein [Desulfocurvus sp.]|jgi:hypothetical protein|uniref:hypothetical protein n=1 Tax=Desulfocurvus sp. TaxID=2871698 RepID=UPI0025C4BEFF|nr:hypothetical protein [Desulfocurvus sp.]MCK9239251.1 hypothetical protein [Desulfocurvus sp.]
MSEGFFPQWALDRAVPDEVFARAYAALGGVRRAWIKKTVAQVHALAGPWGDPSRGSETEHRQGFVSRRRSRPVDCAALFLDASCVSAAQVAAAAVPMLLSGVPNLCAVRVLDGPPEADDVLAALELTGLETVLHLDEAGARRFMTFLVEAGAAAALFQGQGQALDGLRTAAGYAAPPLRLWRPFGVERVGVLADAGQRWDWATLGWVHGCAAIDVYGARTAIPDLPPGANRRPGGLRALLEGDYPVLYVPRPRLDEARDAAPLVLGPGQEGCWAWPGLDARLFRRHALTLADGPR